MKPLRVVFMGTPDFAVASLDAILNSKHDVVAVVTAPDKPAGRGLDLHQSAVKKYALENSLKVLQPEKLKDESFQQELRDLKADIQVVVAFRMLPEAVWNMPPHGTINLHASLLPQYRGAAPINWAVINGEKESGVTTFRLKHEIDTGDVFFREKVDISDTDTAGDLYEKLMTLGAKLLVSTLDSISEGTATPLPQDTIGVDTYKHAPKIFKEDCQLHASMSAIHAYNLIRGLAPYPTAFVLLKDDKGTDHSVKVFRARVLESSSYSAGTVHSDGKKELLLQFSDDALLLEDLQIAGKKRMLVEEVLRGFKLTGEWKF